MPSIADRRCANNQLPSLTLLLSLLCLATSTSVNERKFPDGFRFGAATASHQIEGAWNVDGKSMNNWNYYEHNVPNVIANNDTADIACDSYHKYKEDVQLLKELGATTYRFSISWSRVLPNGYVNKKNQLGIDYYNNLIDELLINDIEPLVTIFHWDLPWNLQQLGGWTNEIIVDIFVDYVRFLYETYGDRVKNWITINEPKILCTMGYGGVWAPGLNASGLADYVCGHNVIKAHAEAYHLYDKEFREKQRGRVGVTLDNFWYEPLTDSKEDKEATERFLKFTLGWFAQPIFGKDGDYPKVMKDRIELASKEQGFPRSRLPKFTDAEIERVRGTYDFMGLNFYSTNLVEDSHEGYDIDTIHFNNDAQVKESKDPKWPTSAAEWLTDTPFGLRKLLNYIKVNYQDPEIMITENGFADEGELCDVRRCNYLIGHLNAIWESINLDNVKLTRYYAWSLIDDFEWGSGYTLKFGLYHVDFESPTRDRKKKDSVDVYKKIIEKRTIIDQITRDYCDKKEHL